MANCVSWVPQLTLLDLWTNWTYKCALRTELVHMLGTYCEAPQTRGRSCRCIVKEPPPLGGRSQQLIGNSVFSNLGVLRISWCFCNSAILPWLPGEAWLWRHERMRGWLTDTQPSLQWKAIFKVVRCDKENPIEEWNKHRQSFEKRVGILNNAKIKTVVLKKQFRNKFRNWYDWWLFICRRRKLYNWWCIFIP